MLLLALPELAIVDARSSMAERRSASSGDRTAASLTIDGSAGDFVSLLPLSVMASRA